MFLRQVKSKGNRYLYLCCYDSNEYLSDNKKKLYSFGRTEKALIQMKKWSRDFSTFPIELKEIGCKKEDLEEWIRTLTTGITKTGRKIKKIV